MAHVFASLLFASLFASRTRAVAPTHKVTHPVTRTVRTRTDMDEVRAFLRLLPRYRVLLHNDDVHTFDAVIAALLCVVPALSPADAERITWAAHTTGRAEVIVCLREQAEHYQAGLRGRSLVSTIEPV